jgi:hypothetical protein
MSPQAMNCKLHDKLVLKNHTIIKYSRATVNELLSRAAHSVLHKERYRHLVQVLNEPSDHASQKEDMENYKIKIASESELATMFSVLYFTDYDTFEIDIPQFIVDLNLPDARVFRTMPFF